MASFLNWHRESSASVFERIQEKGESPSSNVGLHTFINSIKHNLNNILNTHPGTSQSARELGIMDLNDATSTAIDLHNQISHIIRDCILDYEPRISNVEVQPMPNDEQPLTLFFYIQATVVFEEHYKVIAFNLHLDNDHRYYLDMNNII